MESRGGGWAREDRRQQSNPIRTEVLRSVTVTLTARVHDTRRVPQDSMRCGNLFFTVLTHSATVVARLRRRGIRRQTARRPSPLLSSTSCLGSTSGAGPQGSGRRVIRVFYPTRDLYTPAFGHIGASRGGQPLTRVFALTIYRGMKRGTCLQISSAHTRSHPFASGLASRCGEMLRSCRDAAQLPTGREPLDRQRGHSFSSLVRAH